jgi:hypothetical protein
MNHGLPRQGRLHMLEMPCLGCFVVVFQASSPRDPDQDLEIKRAFPGSCLGAAAGTGCWRNKHGSRKGEEWNGSSATFSGPWLKWLPRRELATCDLARDIRPELHGASISSRKMAHALLLSLAVASPFCPSQGQRGAFLTLFPSPVSSTR